MCGIAPFFGEISYGLQGRRGIIQAIASSHVSRRKGSELARRWISPSPSFCMSSVRDRFAPGKSLAAKEVAFSPAGATDVVDVVEATTIFPAGTAAVFVGTMPPVPVDPNPSTPRTLFITKGQIVGHDNRTETLTTSVVQTCLPVR